MQVLFADTADVGILRQHGDVAKIVQSAEDAEFSDFGHTRKEAELDAAVHGFQDAVEPLQGLPVVFLKVGAVKVVDKGFVVFVDENHDRPAGFFISSFDSVLKPCIGLGVFRLHVIFRFNFVQMLVKRHVKILPGLICLSAQIDMQDRVFRPVMLQRLYRQTLEEFFFPLEVSLQSRDQQAFPEPSRTAQEIIFSGRDKFIYLVRLVYVHVTAVTQTFKILDSDRVQHIPNL